MQLGCIKYCCFLCEWDSRDKKNYYVNELWPKRTSLTPGEKNVVNPPLILPEKIICPFAHKAGPHEKHSEKYGFQCLRNTYPNVSGTEIMEGIFIGPQIRGTDARHTVR
jgi:hypothetical protein